MVAGVSSSAGPIPEEAAQAVGNFFGLPPLSTAHAGPLAAAAAIIVVVVLVARLLANWLSRWLERTVVPKFSAAENQRLPQTGHFAAALANIGALALLTIAAAAHEWPPYSNLLFDIAIAIAAAVAARRLALAFSISPSAAMAIAIVAGFAVLVRRYEQLAFVEKSLDSLAVSFGATRISLLDIVSLIFAGIVLYAVARMANRGAKALIRSRPNLDVTQTLLAEKLAAIAITVIAIFAGIGMLGIDTTSLSVFSGAIGLGLGFGLQKIFSNLVSGIILLMDRSIKPGDVIVVGDSVGEVSRIGTRAVSVITRDGKEHLVPNELLMTEPVENWNYSSRNVRIRMTMRVGYESDIDLVERLLAEATRESPRVLNSPASAVRITDISNSGIAIELRFWISDPQDGLGNIQSEIYKRILAKFREHGITLSNEMRDIEIVKVPVISIRRDDS